MKITFTFTMTPNNCYLYQTYFDLGLPFSEFTCQIGCIYCFDLLSKLFQIILSNVKV